MIGVAIARLLSGARLRLGKQNPKWVTLVDRSSRPVRLTPAGERLHAHAIDLLGRITEAEDELRALAGLERGTLRLGAFITACTSFVPPAIARFQREYEGVNVSLEHAEPDDALRRLRAGDIDLAVVFFHRPLPQTSGRQDGLAWQHLGDDPFRLVLPTDHRLASKRRIQFPDLARERFCAPPRTGAGVSYHEMLDALGAEGGFEPKIAYTVDGITIGRALIAAGLCIGIMGEYTLPLPRLQIAVRPLPGTHKAQRTIYATWPHNRQTPGITPMLRLLAETAFRTPR